MENAVIVASDMSKAFGKVIRRRRERLGLSQEALAEKAGIHRTYISSIELGKVRLGLDIAKKVADGLGAPLSELIAEAEGEAAKGSRRV
jgi:transcriptional regulator with XRE-family HTH domain